MAADKSEARARLLDAAVEHVARHGIGDLSLRALAESLGTSHRMLIFHFGSKEGLWVAIAREVERRQRERLRGTVPAATAGVPPREALRAWWKHVSDPALWPNERLFFELYGQALRGRPHTGGFLDGVVEDWLEPVTEINLALGTPLPAARALARLDIAVTRGLLLDLLATGDVAAVDAAMDAHLDLRLGREGG